MGLVVAPPSPPPSILHKIGLHTAYKGNKRESQDGEIKFQVRWRYTWMGDGAKTER